MIRPPLKQYKPPLKRRRLSSTSSPPIHRFNDVDRESSESPISTYTANSNPNQHQQSLNHAHVPEQLHGFKSQLKEILELLPPFTEYISSHDDPNQLFNGLYQVFISNQIESHPHPPIQQHNTNPTFEVSPNCPVHSSLYTQYIPNQQQTQQYNHNLPQSATPYGCYNETSLVHIDPNAFRIFAAAKNKLVKNVYMNIELRCNKIVQSLNKTTKGNAKCCVSMKHFTINVKVQQEIAYTVAETLRSWTGAKCLKQPTPFNDQQAFKMVRAHWNRKKAQTLGDHLFCVVLQNLFTIVSRIQGLSWKDKILFYIDLFCGLLSDQIQFEQSMPRPLILNACFDKSLEFKKLCDNMLYAFSRGTIKLMNIETTKTCRENGRKVSKYVRNGKRSEYLAQSYFLSLQALKPIILSASNVCVKDSIQSHLLWLKQSCNFSLDLIKWEMIPQHILMEQMIGRNNNRINRSSMDHSQQFFDCNMY